jgi:hypothetical protein
MNAEITNAQVTPIVVDIGIFEHKRIQRGIDDVETFSLVCQRWNDVAAQGRRSKDYLHCRTMAHKMVSNSMKGVFRGTRATCTTSYEIWSTIFTADSATKNDFAHQKSFVIQRVFSRTFRIPVTTCRARARVAGGLMVSCLIWRELRIIRHLGIQCSSRGVVLTQRLTEARSQLSTSEAVIDRLEATGNVEGRTRRSGAIQRQRNQAGDGDDREIRLSYQII